MAETLLLEIVTPRAIVFSQRVRMVTLPAIGGELGIYPQHVRLITQVVPGEIVVSGDGPDQFLFVGEGLVEISGDKVVIVTDMALPSDQIDEAKAEEARERAAARLEGKLSEEEVATVNASLARSIAQLHVKRRRRG